MMTKALGVLAVLLVGACGGDTNGTVDAQSDGVAAQTSETWGPEVTAAAASRAAFGFDASPDYVAELLADKERVSTAVPGVPLTEAEVAEIGRRQREMPYVSALASALADRADFAVSYMDHKGSGHVTVSLTKDSELTEHELREIGGVPSDVVIKVRHVDFNAATLRGAMDVLGAVAAPPGNMRSIAGADLSTFGVDEIGNRLEATVPDGTDLTMVRRNLEVFLAEAGYPVKVVVAVGELMRPL